MELDHFTAAFKKYGWHEEDLQFAETITSASRMRSWPSSMRSSAPCSRTLPHTLAGATEPTRIAIASRASIRGRCAVTL